jgi:hypothetical protein
MAAEAGLGFAYWSYRLQSQADVHASPLAIDSAFEDGERGVRVSAIPRFTHAELDSYRFGAYILLDILRPLAEKIPELDWGASTTAIAATLEALGPVTDEPRQEK